MINYVGFGVPGYSTDTIILVTNEWNLLTMINYVGVGGTKCLSELIAVAGRALPV